MLNKCWVGAQYKWEKEQTGEGLGTNASQDSPGFPQGPLEGGALGKGDLPASVLPLGSGEDLGVQHRPRGGGDSSSAPVLAWSPPSASSFSPVPLGIETALILPFQLCFLTFFEDSALTGLGWAQVSWSRARPRRSAGSCGQSWGLWFLQSPPFLPVLVPILQGPKGGGGNFCLLSPLWSSLYPLNKHYPVPSTCQVPCWVLRTQRCTRQRLSSDSRSRSPSLARNVPVHTEISQWPAYPGLPREAQFRNPQSCQLLPVTLSQQPSQVIQDDKKIPLENWSQGDSLASDFLQPSE